MDERVLGYCGFGQEPPSEEEQEFAKWLQEVDARCQEKVVLSIFDLPDHGWRDHYENGTDPAMALDYFLEEEGMSGMEEWS
jgi:hypothetical protein